MDKNEQNILHRIKVFLVFGLHYHERNTLLDRVRDPRIKP